MESQTKVKFKFKNDRVNTEELNTGKGHEYNWLPVLIGFLKSFWDGIFFCRISKSPSVSTPADQWTCHLLFLNWNWLIVSSKLLEFGSGRHSCLNLWFFLCIDMIFENYKVIRWNIYLVKRIMDLAISYFLNWKCVFEDLMHVFMENISRSCMIIWTFYKAHLFQLIF